MLQKFTKGKNLLMVAMLLCFCAFTNKAMGQTWDISDRTYGINIMANLNQTTGILEISGTGYMADFYDSNANQIHWSGEPEFRPPWYTRRSSIRTVIIRDGVTNIGDGAFDGCSNLTSVTIPVTVKTIGVTSFLNCTALSTIEFPHTISVIEGGAFYGCSKLTVDCRAYFYPTIRLQSSYNFGNQYPFNGISKLRVLPCIFNSYPTNDYTKEILYDDTLVTPTFEKQTKNFEILPPTNNIDMRKVVFKVSLIQGINYIFDHNSWVFVGDVYNSSGTLLNSLQPSNYEGIAYVEIGKSSVWMLESGSYTLNYRGYLSVPTGITATQNGSSVSISWSGVSGATSYTVYRSNSYNGTYTAIRTGISGTSTTDTPSSSGTYYYKVEANRNANPNTKSDLSNYVSVNYTAQPITTYNINIGPFANGRVTADKTTAKFGETITLTIIPDLGYKLENISAYAGPPFGILLLQGSDNTRTFLVVSDVTITASFISTTGINDVEVGKINIFPNPAKDDIFIKSDLQIEKVEIYSLTGNLLILENNFNEKVSVSALLEGVYLLKVYTDKGVAVSKIVKE